MTGPPGLARLLRRLVVLSGIIVLAAGIAGALAITEVIHDRKVALNRVDPSQNQADSLLIGYLNEETGIGAFVVSGKSAFLAPYDEGVTEVAAAERQLHALVTAPPAKAMLDAAIAAGSAWSTQYAVPAITSTRAGDSSFGSEASLSRGKALFDVFRARMGSLQQEIGTERQAAERRLQQTTDVLIAVLAVALVLIVTDGLLLVLALRRLILRPVAGLAADTRVVTAGDLEHSVEPAGPREIYELASDVEAMRQRILSEVTSARESEMRLVSLNEDLTRSNHDLERFAYVASHDLQEPLRKVISFCQLLEQRYAGQLDEKGHQYIAFAVDGARRMQGLINDLLAFSRIGRFTDKFEPIPLGDCVDSAMRNLAAAAEESKAEVVKGELPVVWGDRSLLTVLLQNLIGNAIKFRSEEPPVVHIDAEPAGTDWAISVSDNGIGVESRFAEKIFVIFQRLHSREAYSGTGIGLAMCRKIVEFHGGRLWLDTAYSPGSRFTFTMPLISQEPGGKDADRAVLGS